jgi:hypothetical protein
MLGTLTYGVGRPLCNTATSPGSPGEYHADVCNLTPCLPEH